METEYEMMYIVKPISDGLAHEVNAKMSNLIEKLGGRVKQTDFWGKKRLAYEIQDFAEGEYVLLTFKASEAAVKELDRVMRITEEVLRHMIIRKEYNYGKR